MQFVQPNKKSTNEILNRNLRWDGWKTLDLTNDEIMERAFPERMVSLAHSKASRLLSGITIKYSTIFPYLKRGDKILDLCSGSGLGATILERSGMEVTAVDYYTKLLEFRQNIRILNLDIRKEDLPFDNEFDFVTCVDAIEHFEESNQIKIMDQIFKVLKPGGILMMDTPFVPKTRYMGKHHIRELSWDDFGNLFSRFQIEKRYYHHFYEYFPVLFLAEKVSPLERPKDIDQIIIGRKPYA